MPFSRCRSPRSVRFAVRRAAVEALEPRAMMSTTVVADLYPGRADGVRNIQAFGNKVLFAATAPDGTHVYASDRTAAGTVALAGGDSGANWGYGTPATFGGNVLFSGLVGTRGTAWVSDGTPANTRQLAVEAVPAADDFRNAWSTSLNGRGLFVGNTAATGPELFSTDGTDAGTFPLTDALPAPHDRVTNVLGTIGSLAYFADQRADGFRRLGVTDGTVAGTRVLATFNTGGGPVNFVAAGGVGYFQVASGQGPRLWRTDGTAAGTYQLDTPLVLAGTPMAALNGRVLFVAGDGTSLPGNLYVTDGTRTGTTLVETVVGNWANGGAATNLTAAGGYVWFFAGAGYARSDGKGGLWRTDGTPAGTVQVDRTAIPHSLYADGSRLWVDGAYKVVDLADPTQPRLTGITNGIYDPYQSPPFSMAVVGGSVFLPDLDLSKAAVPAALLPNATVRAFDDADGDGVRGPAEVGYAGAGAHAYADVNADGVRQNEEPEAVFGPGGVGLLVGLPAGQYPVRVVDPAARVTTAAAVTVTAAPGQDPPAVEFGLNRNNRLDGTVYDDQNANGTRDAGEPGLAGRRVWIDANGNAAFDAGEIATFTAADGGFHIERAHAEGKVLAELPAGWRATQGAAGFNNSWYSDARTTVAPPFGQTTVPVPGRVSGTVFFDHDGNGTWTPDFETSVGLNLTVFLDADDDGVLDAGERSVVTPFAGTFALSDVAPGQYRVRVVAPPGYVQSAPAAGADPITLAAGGSVSTSAGITPVAGPAAVSGTVFVDADRDGARGAGEGPARGVRVFVDGDGDGTIDAGEPVTVTDFDGAYRFPALPAGTYAVTIRPGDREVGRGRGGASVVHDRAGR